MGFGNSLIKDCTLYIKENKIYGKNTMQLWQYNI